MSKTYGGEQDIKEAWVRNGGRQHGPHVEQYYIEESKFFVFAREIVERTRLGERHPLLGKRVRKTSGYKWPGIIVAVFQTTAGDWRFVVECTAPDVQGALHIFNLGQIVPDEANHG